MMLNDSVVFVTVAMLLYVLNVKAITFTRCNAGNGITSSTNKTRLNIAGFYSSGDNWDATGMIPAVELAVDHVNAQSDLLRDYEICVIWQDSKCSSAEGVWSFHRHLVEEPTKLMFIGPPCSTDTSPVAEASHFANVVTMSYSAASPLLSNRRKFPYFFRTYLPETSVNPARLWLLQYWNWTRIAAFSENHELFILTNNHLFEKLSRADISVNASEVINEAPTERQISSVKEKDIRIFVALAYEDTALQLFCKIYKSGLFGKGYAWIIPGWFSHRWWKRDIHIEGCNSEEIETAVVESMYIGMEPSNSSGTNDLLPSGLQASKFPEQLSGKVKQIEESGIDISISGLESFGYDALLAVALSLNHSVDVLASQGRRLEEFTYNDTEIGSAIFNAVHRTQFQGVTGSVSFLDGDREGPVTIEQLQGTCREGWVQFQFYCYKFIHEPSTWTDGREHCRGLSNDNDSFIASILSQEEFDFIGTQVEGEWFIGLTYDATLQEVVWVDRMQSKLRWSPPMFEERRAHCYVWNIETGDWTATDSKETQRHFICKMRPDFKEKKIVTISVLPNGSLTNQWHGEFKWHDGMVPVDRTPAVEAGLSAPAYAVMCSVAVLGIALAFGFLIFNIAARKHNFVKLSSPRLNNFIVIGCILIYLSTCILGLEVVNGEEGRISSNRFCMVRIWLISIGFVLGFGSIFSKTWRVYKVANTKDGAKRKKITDSGLIVMVGVLLFVDITILLVWQVLDPLHHTRVTLNVGQYILVCDCEHITVWSSLLGVYKGLIMIFGVFLAWQTRNVTIPVLNDSKLIAICVYNTTVLCVIGVGVSVAFPEKPGFQYILLSSIMNFCATFTLIVIFVPKVIFVYKYPKADRKQSTSDPETISRSVTCSRTQSDNCSVEEASQPNGAENKFKQITNILSDCIRKLSGFDQKGIYDVTQEDTAQSSTLKAGTSPIFIIGINGLDNEA